MLKILPIILALGTVVLLGTQSSVFAPTKEVIPFVVKNTPLASPQVTDTPISIPTQKLLSSNYHVFQTFNNCGPAALSMALSYYNISVSQDVLGKSLRPYQNPQGDNDDKSVTLEELAEKSKEYGLTPFHRPAGSIEMIEKFIANGIPVITRTLLVENDDIGHYRVVKGYNKNSQELIQDDSLQGKNLTYSYNDFNTLWKTYNYEYLVLVSKDNLKIAERILAEDLDEKNAWQKAVRNSQEMLSQNPNDMYARLNLAVALYHTGDYQKSTEEFEKVENILPFRTLWYQIEPILSYQKLGMDARVLSLTQKTIDNHNRAFSEAYIIRGEIFKKQGNKVAAREEFEKALLYNQNLPEAKAALSSVN